MDCPVLVWGKEGQLTRHVVFVKRVQDADITICKIKIKYVCILFDPAFVGALGQDNESLLKTPSNKDLSWWLWIFGCNLGQHGILQLVTTAQGAISLDCDVLRFTKGDNLCACQPGVNLFPLRVWNASQGVIDASSRRHDDPKKMLLFASMSVVVAREC